MNHATAAKEILDAMLGYLGFVVTIEVDASGPDPCLQVFSEEGDLLIGQHGDRLDDIQYLLNRLLQAKDERAPRVRIDINHHRAMSEDRLLEEADRIARVVINTGKPGKLEPLNSYHRRIVHNHFVDHDKVRTWSPRDDARLKRIMISLKDGVDPGGDS